MGRLEREVKTQIRRTKINSAIIGTLAVAGVLAVGAVAPNVTSVLGRTDFASQRKRRVESSLRRLVAAGYVAFAEESGRKHLRLTKKGEWFAARIGQGTLVPKKPRRWDGKWRMLMFDIPEKRKKSREYIRLALVGLGFCRLQDSVWVYPYDCEDFMAVLKVDLCLGKDVLYVIADKIEHDAALKKHFGLE